MVEFLDITPDYYENLIHELQRCINQPKILGMFEYASAVHVLGMLPEFEKALKTAIKQVETGVV